MAELNEQLLNAWLSLSTTVINDRVVSELPYNESLICNILYRNQTQNPEKRLTATDLCHEIGMLKSQMNRTLNSMEEKGIISRERSLQDKRQVYIIFHFDRAEAYRRQHAHILKLSDAIIERLGVEKARDAVELFQAISDTAGEILAEYAPDIS